MQRAPSTLIILLLLYTQTHAQEGHHKYRNAVKRGDSCLNLPVPNYTAALNAFQTAEIAAKEDGINSFEADEGIKKVFSGIEDQKNKAQQAEKEALESNLQMSRLISQLTDSIQNDRSKSIIGFGPLKEELLKILIPAQQYVLSHSSVKDTTAIYARAHLQLGYTYTSLGYSEKAKAEFDSAYSDLYNRMEQYSKKKKDPPERLLVDYLNSVLWRCWALMDRGNLAEAGRMIDHTKKQIAPLKPRSAAGFSAFSVFENCVSRYQQVGCDPAGDFYHSKRAMEFMATAAAMDTSNISYRFSLIVYINNVLNHDDSLFAAGERRKYSSQSCALAYHIDSMPGNAGRAIYGMIPCQGNQADSLVTAGKFMAAIEGWSKLVDRFSQMLLLDPAYKDNLLYRCSLYLKIAGIFEFNLKDLGNEKKYLYLAYNDWVSYIGNRTVLPEEIWQLRSNFQSIVNTVDRYSFDEKRSVYKGIITAFTPSFNAFNKVPDIAYIYSIANADLANLLLQQHNGNDSATGLKYLQQVENALELSGALKGYCGFSEDFYRFCNIYSNLTKLYISRDESALAKQQSGKMAGLFEPVYDKYRFDFYLGYELLSGLDAYGQYLYRRGEYKDAIPPLAYASAAGKRSSTDYLIRIGENSDLEDEAGLNVLRTRAGYQSRDQRRMTLNPSFGSTTSPFYFYLMDQVPETPYPGIEGQVKWLSVARGGVVDQGIRDTLIGYQKYAWQHKLSVLAVYDSVAHRPKRDSLLGRYNGRIEQISQAKNNPEKIHGISDLIDQCEKDLSGDSLHKYQAALALLLIQQDHGRFLAQNKPADAERVCRSLLKIVPSNQDALEGLRFIAFKGGKRNVDSLVSSGDRGTLISVLGFYLDEGDVADAGVITDKLLIPDSTGNELQAIDDIYWSRSLRPDYTHIFSKNTATLLRYWRYFNRVDADELTSDDKRREFYFQVRALNQAWLRLQDPASIPILVKKRISNQYNSLAWYCLLTKKPDSVINYLNESLALDPANVYPKENMAHAYLFTGQYEKARQLYQQDKDLPFDKESSLPAFKDAFLSDFKKFDEVGVTNHHILEILQLLK